MKAAKVPYLKKAQSHFNKAMRLSGERDGIDHACAEIAGYIDAHQAAEVYMVDDANAIMYCAGIRSSSNASSTALASVSAASWITDAGRGIASAMYRLTRSTGRMGLIVSVDAKIACSPRCV